LWINVVRVALVEHVDGAVVRLFAGRKSGSYFECSLGIFVRLNRSGGSCLDSAEEATSVRLGQSSVMRFRKDRFGKRAA
jgi:hypothetical protein